MLQPGLLVDGRTGRAYSDYFVASGGIAPYRFAIAEGSLPHGLSLDANGGTVFGSPEKAGRYTFTAVVTDARGERATIDVVLTVKPGDVLKIAPETLPSSLEGRAYEATLVPEGGEPSYRYQVTEGSLPPGLVLDAAAGVISGIPTASGSFLFTLTVIDVNGDYGTRSYTLTTDARRDPAADEEVIGIVDGQLQAARRYAGAQIDNVMQHLQATRGGFTCGLRHDIGIAIDRKPTRVESEGATATHSASSQAQVYVPSSYSSDCGTQRRFGVWTSGSLELDDDGRIDFSSRGLTIGLDVPVSGKLTLGAAFGSSFDDDRFGENGTRVDSNALAFVAYGAYRARERFFVEWMVGYGSLGSHNWRFAEGERGLAGSRRSGHMLFASVSLGSQLQVGPLAVSPFLRNDVTGVSLGAYAERAQSLSALGYDAVHQAVDTLVAGARVGLASRVAGGHIAPIVRAEGRHDFASDFTQGIHYADRPETTYAIRHEGQSPSSAALAAGFEVYAGAFSASVEYAVSAGSLDGFGGGGLRLSGRIGF